MAGAIEAVDRETWAVDWREPLGAWAVTCGGLDMGLVIPDGGRFTAHVEEIEGEGVANTLDAAAEWVRDQWRMLWRWCASCGAGLTDEERARPGLWDARHANCAACAREAGQ